MKWCPLKIALIWISRGTGIAYRRFQPIEVEDYILQVKHQSNKLERQVEQLERELRRRGELPHGDR